MGWEEMALKHFYQAEVIHIYFLFKMGKNDFLL
jgi:hypothetical protein